MFTAGLDVKLSSLRRIGKRSIIIALFNGILPFLTGYYLAQFLGYNQTTSLILGAIFISSSVAIIIPTLKETKLAETDLGKTILSSTVFEDVCSLLLIAFLLQSLKPDAFLSLPIYIPIVIISLIALFFLLPRLQKLFIRQREEKTQKEDIFEGELRFIIIVLIVTALLFELLGVHAIIAGFFVGLFLSDAIKGRLVFEKIYTISYGIFIPIFFLVVGMNTDFTQFIKVQQHILTAGMIVGALILSKFISGFIGSLLARYSVRESLIVASSTIPQLSTTLVVALVAFEFGFFDHVLVSSIVILSIITTLISPFMIKFFHRRLEQHAKSKQLAGEKNIWGMKKETKLLKKTEKKVKAKEKEFKEGEKKGKKEKKEIKKGRSEVKEIKKLIQKKEIKKEKNNKNSRKNHQSNK